MAFNNGYYPQYTIPQYTPPQYTPQMPTTPQHQSVANNLTWVQGEAGAKSYLVAPNTTVQLWDSESQTIYLKSADASGMPSMKILDYTFRDTQPQNPTPLSPEPINDYVTHEELQEFRDEIKTMIKVPVAKRGGAKDE